MKEVATSVVIAVSTGYHDCWNPEVEAVQLFQVRAIRSFCWKQSAQHTAQVPLVTRRTLAVDTLDMPKNE